jgi:predicted PurR-regulated permease PerM
VCRFTARTDVPVNGAEPTPPWAVVLVVVGALVAAWIIGREIGGVVLLFALSVVLAMLLNPAVRQLRRLGLSRGVAVLVLVVLVLVAVAALVAILIVPIRNEVQVVHDNLPSYTKQANHRIDSLQHYFDSHGIKIKVRQRLNQGVAGVQHWIDRLSSNVLSYSLSVLTFLISLIVVIAATTYMLLDASRIVAFAERLGGPGASGLLRRTERTLVSYIKAQVVISLILGVSAGLAMWLLGVTGIFPPGETFAIIFGVWVFFAEFIPYVGPILGALPPLLLAFVTSPLAVISVAIAFIVIQQLEGHIVVPNIMGSAVGVHPLVVIFGLLIGEAIAGIPGVLLSVPMVVIIKEFVTYAADYLAGDTSEFIEEPPADDPGPTSD